MKEQKPLFVKIKDQKNKKWEAKKDVLVAKVERKEEHHPIKPIIPKVDMVIEDSSLQAPVNKGINIDLQLYAHVDMFTMLSQMTIKVPLSKMFRIEKDKNRALEWIDGVGKSANIGIKKVVEENFKTTPKPKEDEGVISQIPPRYLDNAMTYVVEDIDHFLLSLIVNGKNLKNCMIDS